jgi:hypothetical protein
MDKDDNYSFEIYMKQIDAILQKYCGIAASDLDDCLFMDWYKERIRPVYAVERALLYTNS